MLLKEFTYKNNSIFYRITGKGKPVVLLHGFGEDGTIWNDQVEFLKNEYQLIIPDLPGSGSSQLIEDMSIEGMAECMSDLIRHEVLKEFELANVIILGHSMGGYITLAIAEKYPELLHSFGLVHSTAYADGEEKKATRARSIEFIKANGAYKFLKTSIPGLFRLEGRGKTLEGRCETREECEKLIERGKDFTAEALVSYYTAMINRPDRTEVLKNFNGPVLFIIGQHDKAVSYTQNLQECHLPKISHVHVMRESAHMSMLEETDKLNEILANFLRS
jgi:pimeloyl-ACP methyl ester carboxylesterase